MKKELHEFIAQFNRFDEQEIKAIVDNTQVESFKKGSVILEEGQVCSKCYFVLKGCLRQYQLVDGEEKTTGFFTEGQAAVLYSSYLDRSPSAYYLSCVEDSILTTGTREQELKLHKSHPNLAHLVHTLMPQDYAKAQTHLALLKNYTPEERYSILLKTEPNLLLRVPLHQIASLIGVTPESLSRIRKRILQKEKSKEH